MMLYYFSRNSGRRIVHTAECVYIKNVDVEYIGAFETPRDMDCLIPGYHIQKAKKSNILGYFKYIVEHEYYRMTYPACPPQRAKKRQPPRKGTKRYKNQKRREARYERKRAIKNVLNMIDYLSAHETQGCASRV